MERIETFAHESPPKAISRRRMLKAAGATAAAVHLAGLTPGAQASASAPAAPAWQAPPAYGRIVGVL